MSIRILTLGELLMRLKTPNAERFSQARGFEASFGGAETNVAVSLAQFDLQASLITAVPNNPIGQRALQELRFWGVGTEQVTQRDGRLGLYFMENGANQRGGQVIYDRDDSVFTQLRPEDYDWEELFSQYDWLHLSGISPAISAACAEFCLAAVKAARAADITVSLDLNFRAKLWRYGKTPAQVLTEFMPLIDVLIAGRGDCQQCLDIHGEGDPEEDAYYASLSEIVMQRYPNVRTTAITIRETLSAEHHRWHACLRNAEDNYFSRHYEIKDIVDRVGTGDAFAAGIIYGLCENLSGQDTLEFAAAANCLKHSIDGDFNLVSVADVQTLLNNTLPGQVSR